MKIKVLKEDGTEEEKDIVSYFGTQDEYDKVLKSENSKGKGEILKALGVSSVEEAKTKLGAQTQVEEMSKEIKSLKGNLEDEKHTRIAMELRIKPELRDDIIALTKATMGEGQDFKEALNAKAKKLNAIETAPVKAPAKAEEAPEYLGSDRAPADDTFSAEEKKEIKGFSDL